MTGKIIPYIHLDLESTIDFSRIHEERQQIKEIRESEESLYSSLLADQKRNIGKYVANNKGPFKRREPTLQMYVMW